MKPLSFRLLNEQGVVTFLLISITEGENDLPPSVFVQEADKQYYGNVELLKDVEIKDLQKKLDAYDKYKKDMEKFEAMSPSMQATKGTPKLVEPVTVQINRTTHEAFPFMK